MNVARVFAYPVHTTTKHVSPVDYPRIIQPMKYLDGWKDKEIAFQVDIWDGQTIKLDEWGMMVKGYDLVYFNYTVNDWSFAAMGSVIRIYGKKMVMDLDDALWLMNPDNSVYNVYKRGSKGLAIVTDILNEVDYATCTNSYLKNVIAANTRKRHEFIKVFPNYLDLNLYGTIPPLRKSPFIKIVHYGSSSNFDDLTSFEFVEGVGRIMDEYPNAVFKTIGSFFPKFKDRWGQRYEEQHGKMNFMDWAKTGFPSVMAECDIFVAPLGGNAYNRAKSSIKFIEVASTQRAGCWQNIRQYQEVVNQGKNGFLCQTADEWHDSIKTLIDKPELREKMGKAAYQTLKRDWLIQQHVDDYAHFFKKVLLDK